jgi:hypothetical protein
VRRNAGRIYKIGMDGSNSNISNYDNDSHNNNKIMIKNKLRYLGVRDSSSSSNSSSSLSKIMELRMPLDDNAIAENIKSYLHHYISS